MVGRGHPTLLCAEDATEHYRAALEEALHLSQLCRSVTIVNRSEKLRAHQTLQKRAAQRETIRILAPWLTEEIVGDTQVRAVRLRHRESGAEQTLPVDGAIMLVEYGAHRCLRRVRLLGNSNILLQSGDRELGAEPVHISDIKFVGRAVRVEIAL